MADLPRPLDIDFEFGNDFSVIGKPHVNYENEKVVTGKIPFPCDHKPGAKLHAALLGSPHAHANILSIDTSKAEDLEGVEAVITYEDNSRWSPTILVWGQEVAAVAATDPYIAERALELIEVEYEVLPFIIDAEEAMKPGATLAGTFPDSNISPSPRVDTRGDVEAGFAEADVIIEEETGWCRPHTQNTLETCSAIAWWEGEHVFGYDQNQNPHSNNRTNAGALGVKINQCHFSAISGGGGFGGGGQTNEPTTCGLLAKKAGKPVAIARTRRLQSIKRRNHYGPKLKMKLGCKNDGTITAFHATWYADGGMNAGSPGSNCWEVVDSTFECPNFITEVYPVATNKGFGAGYRCLAHPEAAHTLSTVLYKMAGELGMTPLDFLRKTFIQPGTPHQDTGQPMTNYELRPVLEHAAEYIGYEQNYHAPGTKTLPDGRMHGIGIWSHFDRHGICSSGRGALIFMNTDGTCSYMNGQSNVMHGCNTVSQVAIIAETLGVPFEDVHCASYGDPSGGPDGGSQAGSAGATANGSASQMAALDIRQQLFALAAEELGVNPEDLAARDGKIFVKSDPTKFITHKDVAGSIPSAQRPIMGKGNSYNAALRKPMEGYTLYESAYHRTAIAAAFEVAVDTETGEVEILDMIHICDAGRIIDPFSSDGQISSALWHQWSKATLWDVHHDPQTGALLDQTFLDMKVVTSMDINEPDGDINNYLLWEGVNAAGPFGMNGIGEPASPSGYAALMDAINNALGGEWIKERPITPIKILKKLGKA